MARHSRFTPQIISNEGILFQIPLYQRLFSWTRKEVEGLLLDLKNHFDKSDGAYHLGVVTTILDENFLSLVDGQQRLTVLMIMAACFQKDDSTGRWSGLFKSGERLKLYARDEDATYLRNLASCGEVVQGKYENTLMKDAFLVIKKFVDDLGEQKQAFYDKCFERITIFNSQLPPSYGQNPASLNEYFEVMNSSGVNLEQHEVLKVSMLNGLSKESQARSLKIWNLCADFSHTLLPQKEDEGIVEHSRRYFELFRKSHENVDEVLENILSETNRSSSAEPETYPTIAEIEVKHYDFQNTFADDRERSVLTFPEFLLLTLSLFAKKNQITIDLSDWEFFKTDKLISRFGEYLPVESVEEFYSFMLKMRIVLDTFVIRKRYDGADSEYHLTFTSGENDVYHRCLQQFEGMLSVSTPYYKWLNVLFCYVMDSSQELTTEGLLKILKDADNDVHPIPEASNLSYNKVDRYWFWRLDYYLWESVTVQKDDEESDGNDPFGIRKSPYKEAVHAYTFRANRSIEHLHPQDEANNDTWEYSDLNSFGNLAMISQGFNSEQSNDDVHVKFSRIESHIRTKSLQSIKLLAMYLKAKQNPGEWTSEAMRQHEAEMIDFLKMRSKNQKSDKT